MHHHGVDGECHSGPGGSFYCRPCEDYMNALEDFEVGEDEVRDRLSEIVDEVSIDRDARYIIERDEQPKAVLIGYEAYIHLCTVLKHWEGRAG